MPQCGNNIQRLVQFLNAETINHENNNLSTRVKNCLNQYRTVHSKTGGMHRAKVLVVTIYQ